MRKLILIILFFPLFAQAQQLAFPGAEGFGRYTKGGRGGDVYIVDKLTDNPDSPQEGSLRWALELDCRRTIVFAVSGTIALKAPLKVSHGHVTIAGQTAPGDGICVKNYAFSVSSSDVIIRHLRFRCGDETLQSSAQDAMNGKRKEDIIIDHCSLSWSIDETMSFYDNKNLTVQWCIVSESLYDSGHKKGKHGYGGIWGGTGASFHHNLIASHTSRLPRFNGARFDTTPETEYTDFRNNVIFNWGFQNVYGGEEGNYNLVNNYYKAGPATKRNGELPHRILSLTHEYIKNKGNENADTLGAGKFYIEGNYVDGFPEVTADNWTKGVQKASDKVIHGARLEEPVPFAPVNTQDAEEAYRLVLKYAGATKPQRDPIDQRIVWETETGVCKFGDSWGANSGIIDSQKSVGGWPELKSKPAPKDTDRDGMPDEWEVKNKLDPKNASDRNGDCDGDGYTNLEEYLNELAEC
ncbi:pectate lyase family protein [Sunxiuqinia indica]|uniref:pectate lyase family protein n=1 Tax=Sunxiuqinia indica TaxID=2692584 RepID=UPI00135B3F5F|nr:pectate lyase [Sunxiuqinia indica]